jgi:mannose-6-phosphate isomerase-like protein (cupin superfamily)
MQTMTGMKFSMNHLPLLASGQSTQPLLACENLWMHSKVYSRGGENALHAHLEEDHLFFVLNGAAVFSLGDGEKIRAERYEGVMLPKGTRYMFEASGEENLVMLRVGAGKEHTAYVKRSFGIDPQADYGNGAIVDGAGAPIVDNTSLQKGKTPAEPMVEIPGRFFPESVES